MAQLATEIDQKMIDDAISGGFPLLRFCRSIEQRFEADVGALRCRRMIQLNFIALVIYHCFLYGDFRVIGDAFSVDLTAHFLVMTPITVGVNLVLARRPPVWLREGLEMGAIIVLAGTIAIVVHASVSPLRDFVQFTIVLVILFAATMQRLRFWYVVTACIVAQLFYSLGVAFIIPFSMDRAIISNSVFVSILLFVLIGCYNLEHEQRMGYLLSLRDRLRNRQLETISAQDALTGIGNRRALDSALERIARTVETSTSTTAILLLDIDHFKAFNDVNGHQEGDACLKQVADLTAASLRGDRQTAYRFGGEEFLVVLEDTAMDKAVFVAEAIRANVARGQIPTDAAATAFVTVSIGVAAGRLSREITSASLIADADRALYRAKRKGRDRVEPVAASDYSLAS